MGLKKFSLSFESVKANPSVKQSCVLGTMRKNGQSTFSSQSTAENVFTLTEACNLESLMLKVEQLTNIPPLIPVSILT